MSIQVASTSPEFTFQLGETLGASLKGNEILLLTGELGAGKTLFTKGVASALGFDATEIVSPTYTVMNRFDGKFPLFHIDLYRFGEGLEWLPEIDDNVGIGVIIVEWAQYLAPVYFDMDNVLDIRFRVTDEDHRVILLPPNYPVMCPSGSQ
ncbi:MAG: tRNA (adenosine(37)-N6)-threonylcarbamoyltransferase complex ATPase subunit type 1 TsaE [bacterium]|nr:tRNA (adenosine(37)-N6)-threonylcarbamoyltransferase complex ATPase subunit type 1 TsaE [bacterium]